MLGFRGSQLLVYCRYSRSVEAGFVKVALPWIKRFYQELALSIKEIGGEIVVLSANDPEVVGSSTATPSLIAEVNIVDVQLGLCWSNAASRSAPQNVQDNRVW